MINRKEVIFLVKFFTIFVVFEAIINFVGAGLLQDTITASIADFFSLPSKGNMIAVSEGFFEINPSCTGLVSTIILGAIIFSLRKPELKEKAIIFTAGAILLLVLNYFRVLLVIYFGVNYGMDAAGLVHILSWFSTTVFVIGIWYLFTKKITGVKNFAGFI